jgi:hypothetical protein
MKFLKALALVTLSFTCLLMLFVWARMPHNFSSTSAPTTQTSAPATQAFKPSPKKEGAAGPPDPGSLRAQNITQPPSGSTNDPLTPRRISQTVSFMPGQYADIANHAFRKIEIHSEYPIRVASGHCQLDYGVEFICNGQPADIFVTDMRKPPIFLTPRGNQITLTLTEF